MQIFGSVYRNRNLYMEHLTTDPLPTKFDTLNGKPLRDWNFLERMFNAFSPIALSVADEGPGRQLLWDSGYDLGQTTYSYRGVDLQDAEKFGLCSSKLWVMQRSPLVV